MRFNFIRAWTSVDVPDPFALHDLDVRQSKALNGDDGGTWNPTYPIVLGGAGLVVSGPANLPHAAGQSTASAVLSVSSSTTATVSGTGVVNFNKVAGVLNIGGSSRIEFQSGCVTSWSGFTFDASSQLTLTTTVSGVINWVGFTPTISNATSVSFAAGSVLLLGATSPWTQSGTSSWGATFNMTGATTRQGPLVLSGGHGLTIYRPGSATDADGDYDASFDVYWVPSLSADRAYRLKTAGATPGALVTFTCLVHGSMSQITFRRVDGTIVAKTPATGPWWIRFRLDATENAWHAVAWASGDNIMQSQS